MNNMGLRHEEQQTGIIIIKRTINPPRCKHVLMISVMTREMYLVLCVLVVITITQTDTTFFVVKQV